MSTFGSWGVMWELIWPWDTAGCLPSVTGCLECTAVLGSRSFCLELWTQLWIVLPSENHNARKGRLSECPYGKAQWQEPKPASCSSGNSYTLNGSAVCPLLRKSTSCMLFFINNQSCLAFHSRLLNKRFSWTYRKIYVCAFEFIFWRQIFISKGWISMAIWS